MPKKKPTTPRGVIKQAIGRIWLRSRERAAALKRDGYTCQKCNKKQSVAKGREVKVQVHHKNAQYKQNKQGRYYNQEIERLVDEFYKFLLTDPQNLETLCEECHANETKKSSLS